MAFLFEVTGKTTQQRAKSMFAFWNWILSIDAANTSQPDMVWYGAVCVNVVQV